MLLQDARRGVSYQTVIIWALLLVVAVQGFLLCSRRPRTPVLPPVKQEEQKKVLPPPRGDVVGRIAVVLDDWGYNKGHCRQLEEMPIPVGVAILPNLPYSQDVLACSQKAGKEPMLHLPLEPHRVYEKYPEGYYLTTQMSDADIRSTLERMLREMPGIVGVNNHTGSKATEDPRVMKVVLGILKRRKLFFVDSVTTDRSVCSPVARELRMRISRRDVFLDNENSRGAIERQFASAVRIARKRGNALIIGHDRALTLQILKEQAEKLSKEGIEFIPVREYIRRYEDPGN
ncbi:MAG: divergent polysaccharide deacetylase family protein [Elusimicrobia bacterium]|nr:divergent polysaccharide deacetylase family protein [Elusimicrobiota bacterium]